MNWRERALLGLTVVGFLAFALWSVWEGRRLGMRSWWLPIPASLLVGLCFALPPLPAYAGTALARRISLDERDGLIYSCEMEG